MIYYKKVTTNGSLYRSIDSENHIVTEVADMTAFKSINKMTNINLYNQVYQLTIDDTQFVEISQSEFDTIKSTIIAIL